MKSIFKSIKLLFINKNKTKNYKKIANELEQESDILRDQLDCFKKECSKLKVRYDTLSELFDKEQDKKEELLKQLVIKKEEVKELKHEIKNV